MLCCVFPPFLHPSMPEWTTNFSSHHRLINKLTGQAVTPPTGRIDPCDAEAAEPRASRLPETHHLQFRRNRHWNTGKSVPTIYLIDCSVSPRRPAFLAPRLVSGVISGPSFRLLALQPDPWTNETIQPVEGVAVCCHLALIQQGGYHTGVVGR